MKIIDVGYVKQTLKIRLKKEFELLDIFVLWQANSKD